MLTMKSDGFIDGVWQNYLERIGDYKCSRRSNSNGGGDEEEAGSLGISELGGIFVFQAGLTIFAVFYAIMESTLKRCHRDNKLKRAASRNLGSHNMQTAGSFDGDDDTGEEGLIFEQSANVSDLCNEDPEIFA